MSLLKKIAKLSISLAVKEKGWTDDISVLRGIVPDISNQESSEKEIFDDFIELKRRAMHAFQCRMMLKALDAFPKGALTVVDIGDSAGTHMLYLRELARDRFSVETLSVNLDPRAIEKIKARGLNAELCRAEDIDLGGRNVSLFTSFQMVEHLHNPALFFHRIAKKSKCEKMLITVPYINKSRVGFHSIRQGWKRPVYAEDEHIFELSPEDWTLLFLHSGWRVVHSEIYFQYPKNIPVVSQALAACWRKVDYEGFWGVLLEKDMTKADLYQDWEE